MGRSVKEQKLTDRLKLKEEDNFSPLEAINTLHTAISNGNINEVIKISDIAKRAGATILSELLLSPNELGDNSLHKAVKVGRADIVLKLLRLARENNNDTLTNLLLSHDNLNQTALHKAAKVENDVVAQKLLNFAKQAGGNTLTNLLLSHDNLNQTALHQAVKAENDVITWKLLRSAEAIEDNKDTLTNLLLSRNNFNDTALHCAVKVGNDVITRKLLRSAEAIEDNKDTLTNLLLSRNNFNDTALHHAVIKGNISISKALLLAAENIKNSNIVLEKLLLFPDASGVIALDHAITGGNADIAKMLLFAIAYVRKLSVVFNKSSSNITLSYMLESNDINNFVHCLQDARNTKYIEKYTLKELLSTKEDNYGLYCTKADMDPTRSKRSTHEELRNIIAQDSVDNPANTENENVKTKSSGWLQWMKDSLNLPTIFKGAEATVIENKIAHSEEEQKYFNQTNYTPSTSNVDRDLESMSVVSNTNYNASVPLISNGINNNISVLEIVPVIVHVITLLEVVLMPDLNMLLGNHYISPELQHKMEEDKLASDILPTLYVINSLHDEDSFEGDVLEEGVLDLPFTNSSSSQLQGDVWENKPE